MLLRFSFFSFATKDAALFSHPSQALASTNNTYFELLRNRNFILLIYGKLDDYVMKQHSRHGSFYSYVSNLPGVFAEVRIWGGLKQSVYGQSRSWAQVLGE